MNHQQRFERELALHVGHFAALVALFFVTERYLREMRGIFYNIELAGFNPDFYERPTYQFSLFALFFCLITMYVGYKTKLEKPLRGKILFGLGVVFFILAASMLLSPRYNSIWLFYWYWRGYCATGMVLSFLSLLSFQEKAPPISRHSDEILDDLL